MSRPGRFQMVRTDAGWHVRLIGANGEPVMTSEVYTKLGTAVEAVGIVVDAVDGFRANVNSLEEVDERTGAES